jgi:hypothetical protein
MGAAAAQEGAKWERRQHKREQKRQRRQHKREQNGSGGSTRGSKRGSGGSTRGSKMGAAAAQEGAKEAAAAAQEGAKWERRQPKREQKRQRRQHKREQNGSGGSARGSSRGSGGRSSMGSRGERIVGLLGLGSVFLQVFYCGGSFCGFAVYRDLVLLYDIYLALLCARSMLALTSATPGMPYAAVRALGISTPGRSLSRVIPAVRNVRGVRIEVALHTRVCSQVASRARVPASPTGCTRPKRGVRDLRRPPLERDFFFLMKWLGRTLAWWKCRQIGKFGRSSASGTSPKHRIPPTSMIGRHRETFASQNRIATPRLSWICAISEE